MSQGDVHRLLKRKGKPMSIKEISNELKIGTSSVSTNLRKLMLGGMVKSIEKYEGKSKRFQYFV